MLEFLFYIIALQLLAFTAGWSFARGGLGHARLIGVAWRYRRERNLALQRMRRAHYQAIASGQELSETRTINNILVNRAVSRERWIGKQMLANAARSKVPDHLPEEL